MTPLCELAIKHSCNRGGHHTRGGEPCHDYTPKYFKLFELSAPFVQRVLEIGVNSGAGLRMWAEFFPNAFIHGVDINPGCLFHEKRITTTQGNQGDAGSLIQALPVQAPVWDFIVDDGAHDWPSQKTAMLTLLPYMTGDGVYATEDLTEVESTILAAVPPAYAGHVYDIPNGAGGGSARLLIVRRKQYDGY